MEMTTSYSTRLTEKGNLLTRFAHRTRHRSTLALVSDVRDAATLDYGCGDAWLLKTARDQGIAASGLGVDVDEEMLRGARENLRGDPAFSFTRPEAFEALARKGSFDLVLCTETLEHVSDWEPVLDLFVSYTKPGAHLVLTVPIEVGPSLLGKQLGRYLANLRGPYGYETYTLRELYQAAVRWNPASFESGHNQVPPPNLRAHKGFDYRKLEEAIRRRFEIRRTAFTPLPLLGSLLNSTVMWLCVRS